MALARSIVNDAFQNGQGRILTDAAPFTIPYLNSAQRILQNKLANAGVSNFVKDNYLLLGLPAVVQPDVEVQVTIDWQGYWNGAEMFANWTLPQDLLVPLDLRERLAESGQRFGRMSRPQSGIPSRQQIGCLEEWEWRNDKIAMVGATSVRDLQLRYEARLPLVHASANFAETKILIRDSTDAMAWRVAYLFANARGAQQAPMLNAEFEAATAEIIIRNTRADQRIQFRRGQFGDRGGGVPLGVYRG
jgi:hypothetical protein